MAQASLSPRTDNALDGSRASRRLRSALARLTSTTDATWPTILRITLGGVMLPHALQKTLGVLGGPGISGTMQWFTTSLRMPTVIAAGAIFLEQAGAIALIFGLFTRAAAVAIGIVMVGAVLSVHIRYGFFMNWFGNQAGEGFEFHLLVLAMVVALAIEGGGRASLDRALSRPRVTVSRR
jgi:putative oxidoreductase